MTMLLLASLRVPLLPRPVAAHNAGQAPLLGACAATLCLCLQQPAKKGLLRKIQGASTHQDQVGALSVQKGTRPSQGGPE